MCHVHLNPSVNDNENIIIWKTYVENNACDGRAACGLTDRDASLPSARDLPLPQYSWWAFREDPTGSSGSARTFPHRTLPRRAAATTPPPFASPRARAPCAGGTCAGNTTPGTARPRPSTPGRR